MDDFYAAWNAHDAAAVASVFAAGGRYADPITRVDVSAADVREHVQNVLDVIRDFRIDVNRRLVDRNSAVAAWPIEGTWDGKLGAITASEAPVRSGDRKSRPTGEHPTAERARRGRNDVSSSLRVRRALDELV
jgi:hypothetical protein